MDTRVNVSSRQEKAAINWFVDVNTTLKVLTVKNVNHSIMIVHGVKRHRLMQTNVEVGSIYQIDSNNDYII